MAPPPKQTTAKKTTAKKATAKKATATTRKKTALLSPHALRVRARVARLVEPPRSVARRAAAGEAVAPDEMEKVFAGFLKASGLDHEKVTPLGALELICAFYTDVSFRGRPRGMGDMLLYQHGTRGEETTIGFVRQLYARGRGKQLCFNLVYPAPKLRVPESVSLWTTNVASLNEWIAAVKKHVAAAESVSMHPHVKMSLESF